MLDRRAAFRLLLGFLLALAFWFLFSPAYERVLAPTAEFLLRLGESPAVTHLEAPGKEFLVKRADFPPGRPYPGLPSPDLHFNFVLLAALFAIPPRPWRQQNVMRFLLAGLCLFAVHVVFLVFQVESVYANNFREWSAVHYSWFERNFWGAGFHFYQIAGRFAAPFAIWWMLGRPEPAAPAEARHGPSRKKTRRT